MIRALTEADSLDELTELLHAAYRRLGDMGLNYTAVDQSARVTAERAMHGRCLVATEGQALVGTVVYYRPDRASDSLWCARPDVATLGQFAVLPSHQSKGIGRRLLKAVEGLASEGGANEIALDTAERATHLVGWYGRCGYRFIEHAQWAGKTYRSVIMSKPLRAMPHQ